MYLPGEIWEYILDFVSDWKTLYTVCQTQSSLWCYLHVSYSHSTGKMAKYLSYETEKWALQQATSWGCILAIMNGRCQLCMKPYRHGMVQPDWGLYVHSACLSKETISIPRAVQVYDVSLEELLKLPHQGNAVWKYFGGRSFLNLKLMDTVQGVCLRVYQESLHDRRMRLEHVRMQMQTKCAEEQTRITSLKRKHEELYEIDQTRESERKRKRLDELAEIRALHLQPLLVKYRILPEVSERFRSLLYDTLTMPASWRQIEQAIKQWSILQYKVDCKTVTPRMLLKCPSMHS